VTRDSRPVAGFNPGSRELTRIVMNVHQSLLTGRRSRFLALSVVLLVTAAATVPAHCQDEGEGTFSIIARDIASGELGMAVRSKAHAVGSRTISAKGGLAVIAHQAMSKPMYGQVGIELLQRGMTPQQAIELNPAHRRELPGNPNFESLRQDPEFRSLTD